MAELSSEDANSQALSEQFNFASQDELQRKQGATPFNPFVQDRALLLQQQSSNGVVANNNRQKNDQAVVAANPSGGSS